MTNVKDKHQLLPISKKQKTKATLFHGQHANQKVSDNRNKSVIESVLAPLTQKCNTEINNESESFAVQKPLSN